MNIPETILSFKNTFREYFSPNSDFDSLRSLFLIGSCVGAEDELKDWYQDFDIHLFIDEVYLSQKQLDYVKHALTRICDEYANRDTKIAWDVRDRHWKLVPDPGVPLNLSVHATLANRLDYQRRVLHNPVLGWNMYQQCEVLLGDHPGKIIPTLKPAPLDHLHSVGGTGWMIENFYRALWALFTEPDEQDFFPYIAGYCWNVASSVMLQYYSLATRNVTTRKNAYEFLLNQAGLPGSLAQDVERLVEYKRTASVDEETTRHLVNSTARVTNWMISSLTDQFAVYPQNPLQPGMICERDLYSDVISENLGCSVNLREIHYWVGLDEEDFYESFKTTVSEIQERFPNSTSRELYESFVWMVEKDYSEITKVYLWSESNQMRFLLSHDFDFSRAQPSLRAALWGWEGGAQAFMQRLNETYISDGFQPNTEVMARIVAGVVEHQMNRVGLGGSTSNSGDFFECIHSLAAVAKHNLL